VRIPGFPTKSIVGLAAVVCLLAVAIAQSPQAEPRKPKKSRVRVYVLEGLGALGGTTCCGLGGSACILVGGTAVGWAGIFTVLLGSDPSGLYGGASGAAWVVAGLSAAVLPAVAGYGAAEAGERLGEDGSRGWATGGAYAGIPLAVGAIVLGRRIAYGRDGWRGSDWDYPFYVLGGLCIPAGAVVGYNLGAPRAAPARHRSGIGSRLEMPAATLTSVELPDHSMEYGVRVQLASIRF
jgi:MFS family permease